MEARVFKKAFCFQATEVFLRVEQGQNPHYMIVTLGGELMSKTGKDVMLNTERVFVYKNDSTIRAIAHFEQGDMITLMGKVIKQNNIEKLVAFEIHPVNKYLNLDFVVPKIKEDYDLKKKHEKMEAESEDDEEVF
jgi:hypothetical protein